MTSIKHGKRYTPRFKFQVVMEVIKSSKTIGQIARAYGVHPIAIHKWKKEFVEKGLDLFGQKAMIHEYERKVQELEQLIGHKELEIALSKKYFNLSLTGEEKINLVHKAKDEYDLNRVLNISRLSKSTWYYAQNKQGYEERYSHLREPLMEIAIKHPEYGYRRTTSELVDRDFVVNHKVVQRLHRHWHLSVIKTWKYNISGLFSVQKMGRPSDHWIIG